MNTNKTLKDHINEILLKINTIDHQIGEIERFSNKNEIKLDEIHIKLEKFREDVQSCRNIPEIEKTILEIERELSNIKTNLQTEINNLKLEMPEIRLIKKIVLGMVSIILTAFLGVIWNGVVTPKKNDPVEEFAKRLTEEYKKNAKQ